MRLGRINHSKEIRSKTMEFEKELGELYTIQEAAKILRISEGTVWRWVKEGKLPAFRMGDRALRIKKEDLRLVVKRTQREKKAGVPSRTEQILALKEAKALQNRILSRIGGLLPDSAEEIRTLREGETHASKGMR
jgi:excisionase family DNA binding protein